MLRPTGMPDNHQKMQMRQRRKSCDKRRELTATEIFA
jgi:hypothetical protein